MMEENEPLIYTEIDYKTPKQSPQSNQTWPMDKIRQSRFQSLLSPVTPKRNHSIRNAKSLLLQCLRDSKSDPLPRRRFPSYSDEGVLMDGVLVTSATGKKKVFESPASSLGRSARSLVVKSQNKNSEFSSPRSEPRRNQENIPPLNSSGGKGKMFANMTPKAASASKLQATAEPFILTPRSSRFPLQELPSVNPPQHQLSPSYGHHPCPPPSYAYPRSLQGPPPPYLQLPASSPHGPSLFQRQYLSRTPRSTGYQATHVYNQPQISLPPTTPPSKTNTNQSFVQTPSNLSTTRTSYGSRLYSSPCVDGLNTVTHKLQLPSSPFDGLEMMMETLDFPSPSVECKASTPKPDLTPYTGLESMTLEKEWSPCDDGLPTFPQAQTDSHGKILPDDAFESYRYRKRLPVFVQLCSG